MAEEKNCIVSLIVAVAENGVIGAANGIPWKCSTDMHHFRDITMGKPVIMGRRTWESLDKPLKGRENIVLTGDLALRIDGARVVHSEEQALEAAAAAFKTGAECEIMVIGGSMVYGRMLERADRIYHTEIHMKPAGDTYFWPLDDLKRRGWREVAKDRRSAGNRDEADLTFRVLQRKKS